MPIEGKVIDPCDTTRMDALLKDGDLIKPCHAAELVEFSDNDRQYWCHVNAVFQIPTWELIDWLKNEIAGRKAIEIAAGKACLGRHLGIPMTDSYLHEKECATAMFRVLKQNAVKPPADVERLSAIEAWEKYRPEVIIAAWASQRAVEGDDGNAFGVDEQLLVEMADYIHVGNAGTHRTKRILALPHSEFAPTWLYSRSMYPMSNVIWTWKRQQSTYPKPVGVMIGHYPEPDQKPRVVCHQCHAPLYISQVRYAMLTGGLARSVRCMDCFVAKYGIRNVQNSVC